MYRTHADSRANSRRNAPHSPLIISHVYNTDAANPPSCHANASVPSFSSVAPVTISPTINGSTTRFASARLSFPPRPKVGTRSRWRNSIHPKQKNAK